MKVLVLNGSPHPNGATTDMVSAFEKGAKETGHEVITFAVARMNVKGCLGCEYCHTKGEGQCVQKDDWEKVLPAYKDCDMIVFASPIYYFTLTAQMEAAIQRVYCIGQPAKATKAAMLLSSGSPGVYDGAMGQYKGYLAFTGIEDAGVITAVGDENKSEAKLAEVREFAKNL